MSSAGEQYSAAPRIAATSASIVSVGSITSIAISAGATR